MAAARNEQFLVSGYEHCHFVPLHLTLLKISTLNLPNCPDCSHNFQDNYYEGVMKEVLSGVRKSHGCEVMQHLEGIWRGLMGESRALQPAAPETVDESAATPSNSASRWRSLEIEWAGKESRFSLHTSSGPER